jgi:CRISPR-associated protein Cmr4
MSANIYQMCIIDTLTNMHVGSGDTHFGIVDNLIQRHPITKVPVIHSSGIKGALLEYFEQDKEFKKNNDIKKLFGGKIDNESDEKEKKLSFQAGNLIFFEACLCLLPLRSNYNVFYYSTSIPTIRDYFEQYKTFVGKSKDIEELENWFLSLSFDSKDFIYFNGNKELEIEDYTKGNNQTAEKIPANIDGLLKKYLMIDSRQLAVFKKDIFTNICERSLPVIARNQIKDDGTSGNLFYEEVLPRKTKLYFMLGGNKSVKDSGEAVRFFNELKKPERTFQFGANYSIGYGFSKIYSIL